MWLPDNRVRELIEQWRSIEGRLLSDAEGLDTAADELEALIESTREPKPLPSPGSVRCMAYGGRQEPNEGDAV